MCWNCYCMVFVTVWVQHIVLYFLLDQFVTMGQSLVVVCKESIGANLRQ